MASWVGVTVPHQQMVPDSFRRGGNYSQSCLLAATTTIFYLQLTLQVDISLFP